MVNKNEKITAFQLAMITVAYVASLRALAMMAEYGFSSLFYYLLAALMFLVPSALVSAELATAWPGRGGVYVWVKEALGSRFGFLAIWLQFLSNIVSLPAYLSFLAATTAYIFCPSLAANKYYLISFILIVFWTSTFIGFLGMKTAGWINTIGSFCGSLIPVSLILILGVTWLVMGNHSQIEFSAHTFFPNLHQLDMGHFAFLAGLLFSFTGMEISGAHALDVRHTERNYPKGIFLAAGLITLVGFGSISIAIVVPQHQLSLVAGIMQAFTVFFGKFHMSWAVPLLALFIAIGGTAALNSSVIGPSKGFFGSATGGEIPPILTKTNKHGMPVNMFILQAIVVSIFSLLFLTMPSVSSSYWMLAAIVSFVYLCMYVLLFISAIVLRYKRPNVKRPYKVPFGNVGIWICCILGLTSLGFGLFIVFFAPPELAFTSQTTYRLIIAIGAAVLIGVGLAIYACRKPSWQIKEPI